MIGLIVWFSGCSLTHGRSLRGKGLNGRFLSNPSIMATTISVICGFRSAVQESSSIHRKASSRGASSLRHSADGNREAVLDLPRESRACGRRQPEFQRHPKPVAGDVLCPCLRVGAAGILPAGILAESLLQGPRPSVWKRGPIRCNFPV